MVKSKALGLIFLFLVSCGSAEKQTISSSSAYRTLVEKNTVSDESYNGFKNLFHYSATLLNVKLKEMQLEERRQLMQWTESEYNLSSRKLTEEISNQTEVYIQFFTPEVKFTDLDRGDSVWRVFIDVDGKRYMAKIKKLKKNLARQKRMYPHLNPWGQAYVAKFPVAIKDVERHKITFSITGYIGKSKKVFNNL